MLAEIQKKNLKICPHDLNLSIQHTGAIKTNYSYFIFRRGKSITQAQKCPEVSAERTRKCLRNQGGDVEPSLSMQIQQ